MRKFLILAVTVLLLIGIGWILGYRAGKNSITVIDTPSVAGIISVTEVEKGMVETYPDTIFVPVTVTRPERIVTKTDTQYVYRELAPISEIKDSTVLAESVQSAITDWNIKRSYSGTLFDSKESGKLTYNLSVQHNRLGPLGYRFDPPTAIKAKIRIRATVGGEYYTNGQYAFGAGIQYGILGVNVRALKIEKNKYALGAGINLIF
jgi:hypothetical protein